MRSPPALDPVDDCDDIFGPPRTYATGYCPPRNRPPMISAKYKQKEERRKVLKISMSKLKKIEDPESSLCRSVLINNTVKRLQQETREEKLQMQQLNYPRCYDNENYLSLKSDFCKNDNKTTINEYQISENKSDDMVIENDFDAKLAEEISTVSAKEIDNLVEDIVNPEKISNTNEKSAKKRPYDELDDCDVQDVLSQFYMPPTPRMLTGIDDDEDINVVDEEPLAKRLKETPLEEQKSSKCLTDFSVNSFINNNNNLPRYGQENDTTLSRFQAQSETETTFSCGHASMFSDLQSNVYHNLIASLET